MSKVVLLLLMSISFVFAAMNLQTASKSELMKIKGIGSVKADKIIKYRKSNRIKSASDLKNIKGFGPKLISNVSANKTVSKAKLNTKKKIAKVDASKKQKMNKLKNSKLSKEQKLAKKKNIRKNTKVKKQKIRKKANTKAKNKMRNKAKSKKTKLKNKFKK